MTPTSEVVASLFATVRNALAGAFLSARIDMEPVPAPRPRVMPWGGIFYGKPYTEFVAKAQSDVAKIKGVHSDQPLMLMLEIVRAKPKTGKLELPRGDVDNLAKGPMDAITKAKSLWKDDDQIALLVIAKRYTRDGEAPGVNLHWAPVN